MEIFDDNNPFIAPSPEDVDYYGLKVHKVESDSATPEERAAERDDDFNQENQDDQED